MKSLGIILSNFEGNDKKIFLALDNKIDPKFLNNVLENKLKEIGV